MTLMFMKRNLYYPKSANIHFERGMTMELILKYICKDSHGRYVYRDENTGRIWKLLDVNISRDEAERFCLEELRTGKCRPFSNSDLPCSTVVNALDSEPDTPLKYYKGNHSIVFVNADTDEDEEVEKESSIHFGCLGNGITAYDVSRNCVTVAHISDEGSVHFYGEPITEGDKSIIYREASAMREKFIKKWDELSIGEQFMRLLNRANTATFFDITHDDLPMELKVKKYFPCVFFNEQVADV